MYRSCSSLAALLLTLALAGCATLSVSDEQALEEDFQREVAREFRFLRDRVVVDYVDDIGRQIVRASGPQPFAFSFEVIDDNAINAFAGPAGHIYVNTGTILKARNVSELAGVIAHEVGHVARRHLAENYNKRRAAGIGHQAMVLGAGILGGGNAAGAADLLGGLGLTSMLNSFTREGEREADDFAIVVMPRAGYDPRGMPSFFETLIREGGPSVPEFLSSHPAPEDRLADTRAAIAREHLPANLRVDDGGRLEIIQRRIRLLTGVGSR